MSNAKHKAKERDGWECQFCGMDNDEHKNSYGRGLHAHHIVKRNDNGPDTPRNYITVCRDCHRTLEDTQADAISALRDSILSAVDGEYVTAEELFDALQERTADAEREVLVKDGHSYIHEEYGPVRVAGFVTETVGADEYGEIQDVVVEFKVVAADNQIELRENIGRFHRNTDNGYEHSSKAEREYNE